MTRCGRRSTPPTSRELFRILGTTGAPIVGVKPTCFGPDTLPGGEPQAPENLDPARVQAVAGAWQAAARGTGVRLLDLDAVMCPGGVADPAIRADGVHFTVAGADRVAPTVATALRRAVREASARRGSASGPVTISSMRASVFSMFFTRVLASHAHERLAQPRFLGDVPGSRTSVRRRPARARSARSVRRRASPPRHRRGVCHAMRRFSSNSMTCRHRIRDAHLHRHPELRAQAARSEPAFAPGAVVLGRRSAWRGSASRSKIFSGGAGIIRSTESTSLVRPWAERTGAGGRMPGRPVPIPTAREEPPWPWRPTTSSPSRS